MYFLLAKYFTTPAMIAIYDSRKFITFNTYTCLFLFLA